MVVLVCGYGLVKWVFWFWCILWLCDIFFVVFRYCLQFNLLVGKFMIKYFLLFGICQVGDYVVFFNFGYEEDLLMVLLLLEFDEFNWYCIQFYYQMVSQVDFIGKEVLEVSCGVGGGVFYIVCNLGLVFYMGLDLNLVSIDFCWVKYWLFGLQFVQGDVQNLFFFDEFFDVVVNVEVLYQYFDFCGFLVEVVCVFCLGGYFFYIDFC